MPYSISEEVKELSTQVLDSVYKPESRIGKETAVSIPLTYPQIDETTGVDGKRTYSCNGTEVNP